MMELSSLEVEVISCRHLKAFNFFQKLSVYAAVSIFKDESKSSEQQHLQRQKTPVDRDGGSRPEWNHAMKFDIRSIDVTDDDIDHLFLKFDLRCEGVVYGKKCIGEVRVPFKDLVDEFDGAVRFVSYQVRSSEGKANGVLNFSYKIHCNTKELKANDGSCFKFESIDQKVQYPSVDHRVMHTPALNFSYKIHCNTKELKASDGSCSESESLDQKVQYPSVDHRVMHTPAREKKGICYPSLDDIQSSSTGLVTVPTPRFGASELYAVTPLTPPPRQLPHTAAHEAFYHLYHNHVPMLQSPGPYKYAIETATRYGPNGYSFGGYTGVGHSGTAHHGGAAWNVGVAARGGDMAAGLFIGGGR